MSKGSNDDINIAYLEKLAEAVSDLTMSLEKISPSYGDNGQLEKTLSELAKHVQSGEMTLKQMLKEAATTQKNIRSVEYGIEDTARYNKIVNMFLKVLEEKIGDSNLDDTLLNKLTTAFENLDVTAILESEKISQRGGKGAPLKGVMDNEKLNRVNEDLAKRIGLKLDETTDKLMEFFQEQEKQKEKKAKNFANDLLEGLEKSKWVGGALRDTFRLIGLLGANWLSQFGQMGRILGGAFYVAMETFGPQLSKIMLEAVLRGTAGLSKVLWGLVGTKATGAMANLIYKSGGPVLDFMTAPTTAGKVAALGKIGGAVGAMALGGAAIASGVDSWKQGRRGNAAALGLGGAGLIAGGAAVLAGVAAPITVPLIAISGAVAGIAVLWKHHSDTIKKLGAKIVSFFNKVIDFMAMFNPIFKGIQWIRDNWPWGHEKSDGVGGTGTTASANWVEKLGADKIGKLKVAKDGSVLNATSFTQSELTEQLQAYQKARPREFSNIYEVVGSKYAALSLFKNDAIMTDQFTGEKGAVMYRGASEDMEAIRALAIKKGMDSKTAERILYTSGWSSKTSGHSLGALGHGNRYGLAYDIGLAGFSTQEQQWILEAAQERAAQKGLRGQWVRSEANVGGKTVLSENLVQGENMHLHAQMRAGYLIPTGAEYNKRDYGQARAEQTTDRMMQISDLVSDLPKEDKRAFAEALGKKTPKDDADLLKMEEKILKDMGIYADENTNTWRKKTNEGIHELMSDDTGTYNWYLITNTMQGAAQGTTGRY